MTTVLITVAIMLLWAFSMYVAFLFGARVTVSRISEVYVLIHKSRYVRLTPGETIQ